MNVNKTGTDRQRARLRAAAEARIATSPQSEAERRPDELLHELRVHQVELEMQNEALRETQLALEASRDRYADLYEFAPVGYLTLSREGIVEEINLTGASLLGADRKRLVRRRLGLLVAPEDRDRWHRHFQHVVRHDGNHGCELFLTRTDGSAFPAHLDCERRKKGADLLVRIAFADITRLKEAEAIVEATLHELVRSNAELERFAYIASHDLREPLHTVINYSQWLDKQLGERLAPSEREMLDILIGAARRMHSMVSDLLEYSRVTSHAEPFHLVDVWSAVGTALENLRTSIEESGAEVSVGELPNILGDQSQVIALVQNLIANAIKYRAPDRPPRIRIEAERREGDYLFSVRDNGIGIDSAYTKDIFVIFKRLHTQQAYPGTGIGLALCKRIVERHRGIIWVESIPGEGSTFFFTIPA